MAVIDRDEVLAPILHLTERADQIFRVRPVSRGRGLVDVPAADGASRNTGLPREEAAGLVRCGLARVRDDAIAQVARESEGLPGYRPPAIAGIAAAATAAPPEGPVKIPSSRASLRVIRVASSVDWVMCTSAIASSQIAGRNAVGMCFQPSMPWSASSGCTATMRTPFARSAFEMPTIVPEVPTPATTCVTFPSVWRQISGPVVSSCARGFAGFEYWSR